MKVNFQSQPARSKIPIAKRRVYWAAIGLAALACGGLASAQTTNTPTATVPASGNATNTTKLEETTVVGELEQPQNQIAPDLGATTYTVTKAQITALAQGENATFNQVLLRTPGVAQDSLGQLHVRGEHANLQYRINDVLLPEGLSGFGPELSPRFVDNFRLITGALPAQYGFRTAGVVDIHTKSGAFDPGGEVSMYGGSYDTINPSFEYGGSEGKFNYFFDGSYTHNALGIENPTPSATAIHDNTDQYKTFGYMSYILDDTSRLSGIFGVSYSNFEIPNTPGQSPFFTATPPGQPATFNSANLNDRQNEQNYYAIIAYQKSVGDLNLQLSAYARESSVHFVPDQTGELFFDSAAGDVNRHLYSGGLQADLSYAINDAHTLRGGLSYLGELSSSDNNTLVYNTDPASVDALGNPIVPARNISQSSSTHGSFYGVYLQDEWKVTSRLTINYGARFDLFASYISENQISPRVNGIYQATDATTLHAGYARYFTPPPLELLGQSAIAQFDNTTAASDIPGDRNDPVRSERSHYFDVGISQKILPGLQVGVDGYYKIAQHELDDGFFGPSLIASPFNYKRGTTEGVEFSATYEKGGFSTFANIAISKAVGTQIESGQAVVGATTVNYSQNNSVFLDHDQTLTGSFGASYLWKHSRGSTLFYTDALYGSGLRKDATDAMGNTIPNGGTVPAYYSLNVGVEHRFKIGSKERLKARLDVVNLTDHIYELRDGSGVGVNAAQFGERRGFFGSISVLF